MIQKCIGIVLDFSNSDSSKILLINAIRDITDGKIFLEVERARITKIASSLYEAEDNVKKAAELMQELPVETFGSMDRKERIEFILEQLRLTLQVKEYTKAQIISRKISIKVFEDPDFQALEIKYLHLLNELQFQEKQYLECCKNHMKIAIMASCNSTKLASLQFAAIFAVLASYGNEQNDCANILSNNRDLLELSVKHVELLRLFLKREVIQLQKIEGFIDEILPPLLKYAPNSKHNIRGELEQRVLEHNIRTVACTFDRVQLARLSKILDVPQQIAEKYLCILISDSIISAKIDRVTGIVTFGDNEDNQLLLNNWSRKVDDLLSLLIRTNHVISKEEMSLKF